MKKCPICSDASKVHRSHSHGFWEKNLFPLIFLKPLRCSKCRHRFYRFVFQTIPPLPKTSEKKSGFSVFLESPDQEDFRRLQARLREKEKILAAESGERKEPDAVSTRKTWQVVGG